MQEIHEISASIEIMGKAFVDIAKKLKNIKVRVHGDKFKKKRIPTAYNCFVKSQVRKGANMKDVMSTLGAKWKELSAEEKQVYMDQSKLPVADDEEMPVAEKEVVVAVPVPAVKEAKKNTKPEKKEAPKKKVVAKKAQVSDDNESDSGSEEEE